MPSSSSASLIWVYSSSIKQIYLKVMSIREVIKLSKGINADDTFGPILVTVFESLSRDLATIAERSGVSLQSLEAFSLKTTDWQ